jgi:hypothetical protein
MNDIYEYNDIIIEHPKNGSEDKEPETTNFENQLKSIVVDNQELVPQD